MKVSTERCGCFCHTSSNKRMGKAKITDQCGWYCWHFAEKFFYISNLEETISNVTLLITLPQYIKYGYYWREDRRVSAFAFSPPIFRGLQGTRMPSSIVEIVLNYVDDHSRYYEVKLRKEDVEKIILEGHRAGLKLRKWAQDYLHKYILPNL